MVMRVVARSIALALLAASALAPSAAAEETFSSLPPTNFDGHYDAAAKTVSLTWNPPAVGAPAHYHIYRDGAMLGATAATAFLDVLSADLMRPVATYHATAVSSEGHESAPSSPFLAGTTCPLVTSSIEPDNPPFVFVAPHPECLEPPSDLKGTYDASSGKVDLLWDPPTAGAAQPTIYNVYRNGELIGSTEANEYQDTVQLGVPASTATYFVTAVFTAGESAPSNLLMMGFLDGCDPVTSSIEPGNPPFIFIAPHPECLEPESVAVGHRQGPVLRTAVGHVQ